CNITHRHLSFFPTRRSSDLPAATGSRPRIDSSPSVGGDTQPIIRIVEDLPAPFGFLGPNGAGKSSTMRMIGCVSPPTEGELWILGLDPVAAGRSEERLVGKKDRWRCVMLH